MGNVNFNDLISKADKIEALNVFDEIISFIKDIKPSLDTINQSIQENVKKMPQATKKISKVTEATEVATTEILNVLDSVFPKVDSISNIVEHQFNIAKLHEELIKHLLISLQKAIYGNIELKTILPEINNAIERIDNDFESKQIDINEKLQSIATDATSIMMSLQVQDITSQQLAAVKYLLDSIQGRLSGILDKFETSEIQTLIGQSGAGMDKETNETELHRRIAFDPNAVDAFDKSLNRQDLVDDLFEKHQSGEEIDFNGQNKIDNIIDNTSLQEISSEDEIINDYNSDEEISQNDIDKMFDNKEEKTSSDDQIEQNDIYAMFNTEAFDGVDDDEPVSQDDIDKLFGM